MIESNEQTLHSFLRLISVPGIGSNRIRRLIARIRNPTAILNTDPLSLMEIDGIDKVLAQNIVNENHPTFADRQLQICKKKNLQIVTFYDKNYPANLKEIPDPPILFFLQGTLKTEDVLSLGVVGTRNPSDYGKRVTEVLTKELAQRGFTIVSGLARGIDTIAHQSSVKFGARTIAILGSGLDIIYPVENKKLANSIVNNGALISEMPCGSKPDAVNFPKRNRIISGLSLGVLVVEAGEKSGALITATNALNQNREIFAVPGSLFSSKSVGANRLIKEGAKLVQNIDDILDELDSRIRAFTLEKSNFKTLPIDLSEKEKRIIELLQEEPVHIDLIAQQSGFSTSEALSILLSLELKDVVKQLSGKMFTRT